MSAATVPAQLQSAISNGINITRSCLLILATMLGFTSMSYAQTADAGSTGADKALSCEALKQTIEDKLQSKGVKNYRLDVVAASESSSGKIVGHCDGGKHKITYSRDSGSEANH